MKAFDFARLLLTCPSYIFGRFYVVRALFSRWMRFRQTLGHRPLPPLDAVPPSEIVCMEPRLALEALRKTALSQCIKLPPAMVEEICEFARHSECKEHWMNSRYRYTDVHDGRLPDGTFLALGHLQDPTQCAGVRKVLDDPALQTIVANYLGYVPKSRDVRLYWSFVAKATEDERRRLYQTIDFHFDVHDFNFCYVHVYLTETTVKSGAHVMVLGSHKSKPIAWQFGSARRTDGAIEHHYGKANVVSLEGEPGTGFIEDTSCYHKALAPETGERLLLQARYH